MTPKKILMIAGPNGAGKTTFAMVDEWAVYDASGESFILLEDGRRP